MIKKRSELREKAAIILYQADVIKAPDIEELIKNNCEAKSDFVEEIVFGVITHLKELDDIANKYMKDWTIDRIDKMGANILRVGIYELKFTETPDIVVINEAVELAKKYCDDNVRKIINAVLDRYIKE